MKQLFKDSMSLDSAMILVYKLLSNHAGITNCISMNKVADELNVGDRLIRDAISQLQINHFPVGSCNSGYYLITTQEEAIASVEYIKKRHYLTYQREKALNDLARELGYSQRLV
jgi:biotin operon repressor